MPKFQFHLQSFLNLKEKLEDQKEIEYGRALAALEAERQVRFRLIVEKESNISRFRDCVAEKISPLDIQLYNNYIEILKKRIIQQEAVISNAEVFAENKRLQLVDAVKERKMLDKLKEKARELFLREEALAEQRVVDGVVSYRYSKASEN